MVSVEPDIQYRNRADTWAELVAITDEGKSFLATNYRDIQRVSFYHPDDTLPAIPLPDAAGFALYAAESGLIVMQIF